MTEIYKIYNNQIGISFRWKNVQSTLTQVVFRDTGFHLSEEEIEQFLEKIADAKVQGGCPQCGLGDDCKSLLLQTPSNKISLAVSKIELGKIEDLLRGTLFQIRLNRYLNELSKN